MEQSTNDPLAPDYSRKWWVLAAVGSGVFMSTIDGSIVNIALKTLQDTFNTSLSAVEWVVLAYLLVITSLMLSMGRLGDMIGKRVVYITGFVIFTIGSALCSLSWSIDALVAFRALQAIGAAMIQAVGAAILVVAFPPNQRGQVLGFIGTIVAAGISVGPVVGGFLLRQVGWPSIFYINIPIGVMATILALRVIPDDRRRSEQRFDIPGAGMLAGGLLLALIGLTEGQHWGFDDPRTLGLIAGGLAVLGGFVWWENRTPAPMIDLRLFSNRTFSLSLMAAFGVFVALAFNLLLMPYYLQEALGYDPQRAGVTLIALPLVLSVVAPISGSLSDRIGTRWLSVAGLLITITGLLSLTTLTTQSTQLEVVARLALLGVGIGSFQSPNNSTVMGSAPRHALGVAGSLMSVMRTMGQTAGIALAGAIWATRVIAEAGQRYDPVTSAPPEALVAGLHDAMLVAAALAALALVPSFLRSGRPDPGRLVERSTAT